MTRPAALPGRDALSAESFGAAGARAIVLAPHPDDESLAVGGLLQRLVARGADFQVVFATDGENNPWAQRAVERRWRIGAAERERWRMLRRAEALAALARLGVPEARVTFLAWPDQGITRQLVRGAAEPVEALRELVRRVRPTLFVMPALEDLHPDHSALGVLVHEALAGLPELPRPRLLPFVVHAESGHTPRGPVLRLTDAERERKRAAILCHTSQMFWRKGDLLAHAAAEERFAAGGRAALIEPPGVRALPLERDGTEPPIGIVEGLPPHAPVLHAEANGAALALELAPAGRFGAFGPIELLVTFDLGARREGWAIRLPRMSGAARIVRCADGAAMGVALAEVRPGAIHVAVPDTPLPDARIAFVKLERRFGFFDEAGWQLLVHSPATASTAALTHSTTAAPAYEPAPGVAHR